MAEGSRDDPGRVEALAADRAAVLLDLAGQRIELTLRTGVTRIASKTGLHELASRLLTDRG